uniref:Uncharacterized protein n=1 Tax=Cacopsylla melanoneura TaxID=428564 RepID=A0A8D8XCW4_9HEMI
MVLFLATMSPVFNTRYTLSMSCCEMVTLGLCTLCFRGLSFLRLPLKGVVSLGRWLLNLRLDLFGTAFNTTLPLFISKIWTWKVLKFFFFLSPVVPFIFLE